jgi:hypothetical protein
MTNLARLRAARSRSGRLWEYRWQTGGVTQTGLPELDLAQVRRWCQQRVPEHARSQVKVACDVAPRYCRYLCLRMPSGGDRRP